MASIKVSALTAKTSPSGSEELLINDGGTSKKITIANLPDNNTTYTGGTGLTLTGTSFALTDEVYSSAEKTKLSGVEASATADQSNSEIKTAYEANLDTNEFSDAEQTKLSGIATSANNYTHPSSDGNKHVPANSTSNNGKFLQSSGTAGTYTWETVDALPSQTGHAGKYLTTDATNASWATLDTDANTTTKGLYEMAHTISSNYSITSTANAMSAGPITINASITVTVPATSTWVIV